MSPPIEMEGLSKLYMKSNAIWLFVAAILIISCKDNKKVQMAKKNTTINQQENILVRVPDSWINGRVEKAKTKLMSSEAGKIVWAAMEAHGGLSNWYGNGALSFHFNYQPLDGGAPRTTYQTVDAWSLNVKHKNAADSTAQYGLKNGQYWLKADSTAFKYNTRFWTLTPIYFVGQPFILDGSGVNLSKLPEKEYKGNPHNVVKVTFDSGTGDAPDDYYILYFDTDTHRLKVIRYIVSYPGYFEKGEHLPEKFMELHGEQFVLGICFPTEYKTYWLQDNGEPGEHITNLALTEVEFLPKLKNSYFNIAEGAQLIDSL